MEVIVDIKYEQLLAAVKKLPAAKIKQLMSTLDEGFINEKAIDELTDFQNYLLKGPLMDDGQFAKHQTNRKHFSEWRTN